MSISILETLQPRCFMYLSWLFHVILCVLEYATLICLWCNYSLWCNDSFSREFVSQFLGGCWNYLDLKDSLQLDSSQIGVIFNWQIKVIVFRQASCIYMYSIYLLNRTLKNNFGLFNYVYTLSHNSQYGMSVVLGLTPSREG